MKKTSINSTIVKYLFPLVLFLCTSLPVLANDDDEDPESLPPDPATPISDYWWVLALIGIYFIYKKYQVLQKQA
ncbi:MAG: hypothetical protein KGZ81_11705 [Flavobacteriales bacterium]|nr:hypothetical protein [Flavobacteriales bacterium]